jgi:hypothetical protein
VFLPEVMSDTRIEIQTAVYRLFVILTSLAGGYFLSASQMTGCVQESIL